jgi:hypothetical protein
MAAWRYKIQKQKQREGYNFGMIRTAHILLALVSTIVIASCSSGGDNGESGTTTDLSNSQRADQTPAAINPAEGFKLRKSELMVVDTSSDKWRCSFTISVASESQDSISLKTRIRLRDSTETVFFEQIFRGLGLPAGADTVYRGMLHIPADSMRRYQSMSVDMMREVE